MDKGIIYALLASMLWGLDYAIAEKTFEKVSIYTVLFLQLFVGVFIMLGLGYGEIKKDIALTGNNSQTWTLIACCIIFNVAMILVAKSIKYSDATVAGMIEMSYPIFIIIATYILFRENHLNKGIIVGGLFIFVGIAIIYFYGDNSAVSQAPNRIKNQ